MGKVVRVVPPRRSSPISGAGHADILNALSDAVLTLDGDDAVLYANQAAEQLFATAAVHMRGRAMQTVLRPDSPFFDLLGKLRAGGDSLAEHDLTLTGPRFGERNVALRLSRLPEYSGHVAVAFTERTLAERIDRQLTHRNAGRSLHAMAAMLAHEVKNPLSGIRGAAQLLGDHAESEDDRELTSLITAEADRIRALVERVEVFADDRPAAREPVNLHEVLEHVRRIAENGFAKRIRLREDYDPSLPPALGNREQLIQVFLNLLKNACEAVDAERGEVVLETAYRHGVRLAVPGSQTRYALPLRIGVRDNGSGIPEDLQDCLFDPFITTKAGGTGLGLAVVSKIINDHGGVAEFDSRPGRTVFNILLPVHLPPPPATPQPARSRGKT